MPTSFFAAWESGYFSTYIKPEIEATANATKVRQLLQVTDVSPYQYLPPTSTSSISEVLQYNVYATEDGKEKLGGQPFDNQDPYREYEGSNDDEALNAGVARFSADPAAQNAIAEHYQTTGKLSAPLVTLHTTGDPVVPYWHATRYRGKTIVADNIALHQHFKVDGHGHCAFDFPEILTAFNQMVDMVETPPEYRPAHQILLPVVVDEP
jgi:hypothetical protein